MRPTFSWYSSCAPSRRVQLKKYSLHLHGQRAASKALAYEADDAVVVEVELPEEALRAKSLVGRKEIALRNGRAGIGDCASRLWQGTDLDLVVWQVLGAHVLVELVARHGARVVHVDVLRTHVSHLCALREAAMRRTHRTSKGRAHLEDLQQDLLLLCPRLHVGRCGRQPERQAIVNTHLTVHL